MHLLKRLDERYIDFVKYVVSLEHKIECSSNSFPFTIAPTRVTCVGLSSLLICKGINFLWDKNTRVSKIYFFIRENYIFGNFLPAVFTSHIYMYYAMTCSKNLRSAECTDHVVDKFHEIDRHQLKWFLGCNTISTTFCAFHYLSGASVSDNLKFEFKYFATKFVGYIVLGVAIYDMWSMGRSIADGFVPRKQD